MASDLITYPDKVDVNSPSGLPENLWTKDEQNEIKSVLNSHASDLDDVTSDIDIIKRQSIVTVDTVVSGKTLGNNDYAKLFRCNNSSDFTFTIDTNNTIPLFSLIYFQRVDGKVTLTFSGVTNFGVGKSSNSYEIELKNGVICVLKYTATQYFVFGNLKI